MSSPFVLSNTEIAYLGWHTFHFVILSVRLQRYLLFQVLLLVISSTLKKVGTHHIRGQLITDLFFFKALFSSWGKGVNYKRIHVRK